MCLARLTVSKNEQRRLYLTRPTVRYDTEKMNRGVGVGTVHHTFLVESFPKKNKVDTDTGVLFVVVYFSLSFLENRLVYRSL